MAVVSVNSTGIQSIDQVFNGFGYIGSTVFALPGVKGLIPNGRNADGSLKNIEFTIDSVKTVTKTWVDSHYQVWGYIKNPPTGVIETWYWNGYIESDEEPSYNEYIMWYKPSENITYVNNGVQSSTPNWEKVNYINFGRAAGIKTQEIKIFTPKTAFHALDYNDRETIVGWGIPDYSAGITIPQANAFPYTAHSNGLLLIAASSYSDVKNEFFINGNSVAIAWSATSGTATTFYQPVYMKKGETVTTTRTQNAPVNNIFYPLKGTV